ncbi:dipeptidase [Pedobacter sp. UBA4863]|uniref:dipeptidase n=1 Tax=Pedobacter sp. UBA4863 TaxID=1947060 RepID=UPI0025D71E34|nr:dipeptidase [Pedobacter sp. UBA4863]
MKKQTIFIATALFLTVSTYAQNVNKIHKKAILIDTHDDVLSQQINSGYDLAKEQPEYDFDLVKAKRGGLDAQVFSIWCDEKGDYSNAIREIDSLYALLKRHPDKIALATTAEDLRKIVAQNKLAALIGVEGGHMINDDLAKLDELAKRGMIYLTLTWNNSTAWATSAVDERGGKLKDRALGLNEFGKKIVKRLNELGVMVDLSHVGEQTFYDAIKLSTKPVILSHSCVHAINPVPRNITDEQILAVGKNGGVISVNFYNGFVMPNHEEYFKTFLDKYKDEYRALRTQNSATAKKELMKRHSDEFAKIQPSIDLLVDHIDHIVKLIGIDHVGIGADYDGATSYPKGLNNVADYPKLTEVLLKRGYTEKDIHKIYGENFLRVLKANKGK